MRKRPGKLGKIVFFGHFDGSNFGNEATLQATLFNLRRIQPDAEIACICTGPQATAKTYNIRTTPIARSYVGSWRPGTRVGRLARKIAIVAGEPVNWLRGIGTLRGSDMLVVPGTGLLTDAYGLFGVSWGPYSLLKWSLIARICRCELAFMSVGAGPVCGPMGGRFIRTILSLASFRSYREESTVRWLRQIGVPANTDQIFPDLAFSLPRQAPPARHGPLGAGAVVGLGVMENAGNYSRQDRSAAAQTAYLTSFAQIAIWLLTRGYRIRLLSTDRGDVHAKERLLQLITEQFSIGDRQSVIDEPIDSVPTLMSQIAATDAVIATRFHNILLAFVCEKPVISIAFHHKCDSLMATMGLSEYCINIGDLTTDVLIETFCRLENNAEAIKSTIRERSEKFRDALDKQYQLVFGRLQSGP